MGKYMPKKSKLAGTVVEVPGVRTRAKTLALQRLNGSSAPSTDCYLQLRSRRLEKPPFFNKKRQRQQLQQTHVEVGQGQFGKNGEIGGGSCVKEDTIIEEGSYGENNHLGVVAKDRSTRESTPCSLIRDPEKIETPCSTTKEKTSASNFRRVQSDELRHMPTTRELDEFFSAAEQEQQRLFIDKYNFDIVNDLPLPGRFEWSKVTP
ncbi:hypothetical protein ACFE04_030359 [Oxalis oulophora]